MPGVARDLPEGFRYEPEIITPEEEERLLSQVRELPLREFEFHGYLGKRRVLSYGWRYDFSERTLSRADDVPAWLEPLRQAAASFAGLESSELQQVLVTEYTAGTSIGWHRDKAVFGDVIGVSLLSPCRFRLRRKAGSGWQRASLLVEPRSAYLLRGPSRTEWEHSIPAVESLRYSITFRNLLRPPQAAPLARDSRSSAHSTSRA